MNLVEWTDADGYDHLSWLREQDPPGEAAMLGIPHDPPDLTSLGLRDGQEKALHNALIAERLIIWRNATDFKQGLTQVGTGVGLDNEQLSLLAKLYAQGPPKPADLPFDLSLAIDALPLSNRDRECIKQTFAQAGIRDLRGVENAPTKTGHICGLDIYQIIALLTGK